MLIADDDRDLRELIGFTLTQAGYLVLKSGDGPRARCRRSKENESPDLVVLDYQHARHERLPGCARAIRKRSRVPVIMLTVRGEEEDLVSCARAGAPDEDFLTKPFSPRTLLARIKALLRRAGDGGTQPPSRRARITLDIEEHTVQNRAGGSPCGSRSSSFACCRCYLAKRRAHRGAPIGCSSRSGVTGIPATASSLKQARAPA